MNINDDFADIPTIFFRAKIISSVVHQFKIFLLIFPYQFFSKMPIFKFKPLSLPLFNSNFSLMQKKCK